MAYLDTPEWELRWLNSDGEFVSSFRAEWDAPAFAVFPNGNCVPFDYYSS